MSRTYGSLECGCFVSCDGGGGLLTDCESKNCKFEEYSNKHWPCKMCGECFLCGNHTNHLEDLKDMGRDRIG